MPTADSLAVEENHTSTNETERNMAGKVSPIPEGCHSITPHLIVDDGEKAIDFYTKAFGAKELFRVPSPGGIAHAELQIGDSHIYLCAECPEMGAKSPKTYGGSPVGIHLYVEDVDTAFKTALDAGCKETMPLSKMFWGDRYGKVTDPFGHTWSLATHVEDVPPEELPARAEAAMCGQ
jgi:PhnB protein